MSIKTFLMMRRTIRLPFRIKTVKIVYYNFSTAKKFWMVKNSEYKKNSHVKIFGRNFCPNFFAFSVCNFPNFHMIEKLFLWHVYRLIALAKFAHFPKYPSSSHS